MRSNCLPSAAHWRRRIVTPWAARAAVLVGLSATGCLDMLGLDGEYVAELAGTDGGIAGMGGAGSGAGGNDERGSGGTPPASGGMAGSGGLGGEDATTAPGGMSGTGGMMPDSGPVCTSCAPDTKCCFGECTTPSPLIGCSLDGCEPCPAPPMNADPVCVEGACDYVCQDGFTDTGTECVPMGTGGGGSGGTSDSGGAPPTCMAGQCMDSCGVAGPFPCCRDNGECGCSWALGAYCFPLP